MLQNLGNCADQMFLKENSQPVLEFNNRQLVTMQSKEKPSLDKWFSLYFSSGCPITTCLDEDFIVSTFYTNQDVVDSLGQEMCIAIDIALAGSCEAVVEGFYSVVGAHKKSGGQSNKSLAEGAIVDRCLPHPICCPATMKTIANIYSEGNKKHHLPKHRNQAFTDVRGRASAKFSISKIVDRIASDTPQCPHVLTEEQQFYVSICVTLCIIS